MSYDLRLQRLESQFTADDSPVSYALVIDETDGNGRVRAMRSGDLRVERAPGESEQELYVRASADIGRNVLGVLHVVFRSNR